MSKQQVHNYRFDSAAGLVTLVDFDSAHPVTLDRLLVVSNATTAECMFTFADSAAGLATAINANTFALTHSTAGMADTDALDIFYDCGHGDPIYDPPTEVVFAATQGDLGVNLKIDGEDVQANSPGVAVVSLAGPTGDAIDTRGGGLLVTQTGAPSQIKDYPGQTADLVAPASVVYSLVGARNQTLVWDVGNYKSVTIQTPASMNGATIAFAESNDGLQFTNVRMNFTNDAPPTTTTATSGIFATANLVARFFRITITAATASFQSGSAFFSTGTGYPQVPFVTPADTLSNTTTPFTVPAAYVFNGTTWDRMRDVLGTTNTTGTGVLAAGVVAQYDDVAPQQITEGSWGNARLTQSRSLHEVIRDGSPANSEYGATVSSQRALQVMDLLSGILDGTPVLQVTPGVAGVSLVGPTGDPLDTIGGAIPVSVTATKAEPGIPRNNDDLTVSSDVVTVLEACPGRKAAVVQNTGAATVRVTIDGSTPSATHGLQVLPGQALQLSEPRCPTMIVKAIAESATASSVSPLEIC